MGFDHNAGVSHGEGSVVSCKFTGNTTDNVILGGTSTFMCFIGCTFYGFTGNADGRVSLTDGIFSIGFHECSFEQSYLWADTGANVSALTVQGCFFAPTVESGEQYCIEIDELVYSRIQQNIFNPTISAGATSGGVKLGSNSKFNEIGPNKFSFTGAGTGTTYSPGNMGGLYCTQSTDSIGGQPDSDIKVVELDVTDVTHITGVAPNLAVDGVRALGDYTSGLLVVKGGESTALYHLGSSASTLISDVDSAFSVAPGTAGTINVYYSGGNSRYEVENKRGSAQNITAFLLGF